MLDNTTGTHVKSRPDESVRSKIVDATGTNEAVVDSSGQLSVVEGGASGNSASQVTVSNVSTILAPARSGRRGVQLVNNQSVAVYVNPSGTTATTGHFKLIPEAGIFLPVTSAITAITAALYTPSSDDKVHVMDIF